MTTETVEGTAEVQAKDAVESATTAVAVIEAQYPASYRVTDDDAYIQAGAAVLDVKARARVIEEKRVEITGPINKALRAVNALFKAPTERLDRIAKRIGDAMIVYRNAQEAAAQRERSRLAQIAAAEAAKEQAKLDKAVAKAEAKGDFSTADALRAVAPIAQPVLALSVETPKVAGLATRTTWRAEVVDVGKLLMAAAAGEVPASVFAVNDKVLQAAARDFDGALNWPGVRCFPESTVVGTGR
jgi:hypothetical protein